MPRFFTDNIKDNTAIITNEDAKHIAKSLRMNIGDELTICNCKGKDFLCTICEITSQEIILQIGAETDSVSEPDLKLTLYQALPKGEKFETIIQKCVELGIYKIVPIITSRTVSRPDMKNREKKRQRWQKIATESAKQSGRGVIPQIDDIKNFKDAGPEFLNHKTSIIFYENSKNSLKDILKTASTDIGIMVGSEGGFDENEVDILLSGGAYCASLGSRILRCETAPVAAAGIIMYQMNEM